MGFMQSCITANNNSADGKKTVVFNFMVYGGILNGKNQKTAYVNKLA